VPRARLRGVDRPLTHLDVGRIGEDAAVSHYLELGYRVLARNWRCRVGELDVVLLGPGVLVFCEVKSRRGSAFGLPFEAVHPRKQRKLRVLAEAFMAGSSLAVDRVRFDVASVIVDGGGRAGVHLFEDAF
jgi:putative endonuclease